MTAASGHSNQPPILSIETPHFTYPPPSFLASSRLGFTSFDPLGQRSVDLPGRHGNSRQHQMSSELADHVEGRQRALLGQPPSFWRAGEAGQKERERNSIFCQACSLPPPWLSFGVLSAEGCGRGVFRRL